MPRARAVLLIEDIPSLQLIYRLTLAAAGYEVLVAGSASAGMALFRDQLPPVVLLDMQLPDRNGLTLLGDILTRAPETVVIVVTAHGSIPMAVEAMRAGAYDFLTKPVDEARLLAAVATAQTARAVAPVDPVPDLLGDCAPIRHARQTLRAAASTMAPLFVTGETGTGKTHVARLLHQMSPRAAAPFVPLDCLALAEPGLPEEMAAEQFLAAAHQADGGTLVLEGVTALPHRLQARLLQVLQAATLRPTPAAPRKRVNLRLVSTAGPGPVAALLRDDLLHRLNVVPILLPPLRARGGDILTLAQAALTDFAVQEGGRFMGFSDPAARMLRALPWHGNVRQLHNAMRQIAILHAGAGEAVVTPDMLPPGLADGAAFSPASLTPDFAGLPLAQIERLVVEAALERHAGSVPLTARELQVAPSTLYRKLESWARRDS